MLDRLDTMINKEFCTILQLVTRLLHTIKNIHGQILGGIQFLYMYMEMVERRLIIYGNKDI